jgi:hypothetical protein
MPNRTDPFHYHFAPTTTRRGVYPSSPPPGSPPNEFRDEFERPLFDADLMLSAASIGDSGGQYYSYAPPSPRQPAARRSRPFCTRRHCTRSCCDNLYTEVPREQARTEALDHRRRSSYGREPVVEETEVGSGDKDDGDGDEGLRLRRMGSSWWSRGGDDGRRSDDEDDDGGVSLAAVDSEVGPFGGVRTRAAEAVHGSVSSRRRPSQPQKDPKKRKLSAMFSEAIIDIGKGIKKRTDSLVWRKDSGAEMQEEPLPQVSCIGCKYNATATATTDIG